MHASISILGVAQTLTCDPVRCLGAAPDEDQIHERVQYAWAAFNCGRHIICSGYTDLVMKQVPAALRAFLKRFDLQLMKELCPFDGRSLGFRVTFPINDIKIRFKRCK